MKAYEELQFENEVYYKLKEADKEIENNSVRYSAKDVQTLIKELLKDN